jgi:hypothetical protein
MRSRSQSETLAARGIDQPAVPIRTSAVLRIASAIPLQLAVCGDRWSPAPLAPSRMGHWDHGSFAKTLRARFAPRLPLS